VKRTGQCFCGGVKYEISGRIYGARSCHCSRCRKAFGAQASSYALIEPDALVWIQGQDLLTTYPAGGALAKQFCRICGSTLCGVVDGKIHGITLGCLDEDQGIQIEAHIFVGSKAAWEVMPDSVPQFDAFPPDWGNAQEN